MRTTINIAKMISEVSKGEDRSLPGATLCFIIG